MLNSTNSINMEKLFETSSFSKIQDIYLLDGFAIAKVDDKKLVSIFYTNFKGKEVPSNYI